jgi:hypothetical protein
MNKVAKEVAEGELGKWFVKMRLVDKLAMDPAKLDEEDRKAFAFHREIILHAMMKGDAVVNESGELVFSPADADEKGALTFRKPTTAMLRAGDTVKPGEYTLRQQKQLGAITETSAARFADMDITDFSVCESVLTLFSAK